MPSLIATQSFRYENRPLCPGDVFSASDGDARLLVVLGKAKHETDVKTSKKSKRKYKRRDMQAEA